MPTASTAEKTRALCYAAEAGYVVMCRALLEAGAEMHPGTPALAAPLWKAVTFGRPLVVGDPHALVDRTATIRFIGGTMVMRDIDIHVPDAFFCRVQRLFRGIRRQYGDAYVAAYCAFQRSKRSWRPPDSPQCAAMDLYVWACYCRRGGTVMVPIADGRDVFLNVMCDDPVQMLHALK